MQYARIAQHSVI